MLFAAVAACGGASHPTSSPSPSPTPSPTAPPTPTPFAESPRDLLDLAKRFRGYPQDGPAVARTTPFDYQVGAHETFNLISADQNAQEHTVDATLRAISDHAYFFIEDGVDFDPAALAQEASDFDQIVWPAITSAFGEPRTPGVDGDPRITILHAHLQGAGGYVSGEDEYPVAAVPSSNQREMLYIDQGALAAPGPAYNSLVGHELQHLVHQNYDASEDSWVNEGLSQVAAEMAGGAAGVQPFLDDPGTQLNFWPYAEDTSVHYAESELFFDYLLDHYGGRGNANKLLSIQDNGIEGVSEYLAQYGKTFDEVFSDFVAANLLDQADGPYSHPNFDGTTTDVSELTAASGDGTVSQFGTTYLHIAAQPGATFRFQGSTDVSIGIPPTAGAFWWSGRMDGMDARLTREIDLSGVQSATLKFDAWYDLEPGWDFSYVAVSDDGGVTWKTLPSQDTTEDNPVGSSYGAGYTGKSPGWVTEQTDLSDYAGKKVLLRFETVNDDAVNLTGFAVDNIRIPEISYYDDASTAQGWRAEGFRQVTGPMRQRFVLQIIGQDGSVGRMPMARNNAASLFLTAPVTIAISGVTPDTTEAATYTWTIGPTD